MDVGTRIIIPADITAFDGDSVFVDTVQGEKHVRLRVPVDAFEEWEKWYAELKAEAKRKPVTPPVTPAPATTDASGEGS